MQRWFYANEELVCDHTHEASLPEAELRTSEQLEKRKMRNWRFCVRVTDRELWPNEALAVCGNCTELGDWKFENCIVMTPVNEGNQSEWHVFVDIPANVQIFYRYLIVAIDPERDQMIVRFFESHLKPRRIKAQIRSIPDVCHDVFGLVKSSIKVERGWLTSEYLLQLMFFKAPFNFLATSLKDHIMQVKVTPFKRKDMGDCVPADHGTSETLKHSIKTEDQKEDDIENVMKPVKKVANPKCGKSIPSYTNLVVVDCEQLITKYEEESTNQKNQESSEDKQQSLQGRQGKIELSTAFAFNEVIRVNQKDVLKRQPAYGTQCHKDDLTMFHLTIGDFENTVYLIEIFTHSKNAASDEKPYLVGYRYLLPEDLGDSSQGYIEAPIICASTHRLLGDMKFRFLVIHPTPDIKLDLSISYLRHWDHRQESLDVGHRGQGATYFTDDNQVIYENTIRSMQKAVKHGADMIEFDVHLTRDAIPVIYHDFNVHVSQTDPLVIQNVDNIDLPINKLSLVELQNLKLPKHIRRSSDYLEDKTNVHIGDAIEPLKLFPLLSEVMDAVSRDIAFLIEIKWPQQYCNGKWEENVTPSIDRNFYIDEILKVIMEKARNRRIVIICFDADMCTMLRFKQNRYPIMFLLPEESDKRFLDARSSSCETGVFFSYGMEFLGVIPYASTLSLCPSLIGEGEELNIVIFCYGLRGSDSIKALKDMGVSAVILDRMDELFKDEECKCACCGPQATENEDSKAAGDKKS